jgi:hypothetical protein
MTIAVFTKRVNGVTTAQATLLDAVVGVGNSEWIDVRGLKSFSLHTSGISGDTIVYSGSNAASKPAAADHEIPISTITSDGMDQFTVELNWLKARMSVFSAGSVTTRLEGHF